MVESHLFLVNIHKPVTVFWSVAFCITWQLLVLWLDSVPHKYKFILGKYTKSDGARSVEYGWWIARWNPNTSIYSNVFIVVWHVAWSWCNSTFAIRAEKSWSFFHNACMRRGEPSWTKQHNNSQMWRTSLIKVSNIQSNKSHTQIRCEGVLYCIFTNTSHPSNFLYGASLVTVDVVPLGIHYSAIFILLPWRLIRATLTKSTMPSICMCSWNILVTFCWFQ